MFQDLFQGQDVRLLWFTIRPTLTWIICMFVHYFPPERSHSCELSGQWICRISFKQVLPCLVQTFFYSLKTFCQQWAWANLVRQYFALEMDSLLLLLLTCWHTSVRDSRDLEPPSSAIRAGGSNLPVPSAVSGSPTGECGLLPQHFHQSKCRCGLLLSLQYFTLGNLVLRGFKIIIITTTTTDDHTQFWIFFSII